jgi:hypothetical protein
LHVRVHYRSYNAVIRKSPSAIDYHRFAVPVLLE